MVVTLTLMLSSCASVESRGRSGDEAIKVVVVTGGHGFDREGFLPIFEGYEDIEYTHFHLADDSEIFEDISEWPYDVIVFYHMTQNISEKRRANFKALLDDGVGVVALHHTVGAYQQWPEFQKIIGAKFYLKDSVVDGQPRKKSGYKHGLKFNIYVEDTDHPVTSGISDFEIHDETYIGCDFESDNHVLLTTDDPTSDRIVGLVRNYGKARICYLQPGHDKGSYADSNYRKLVIQAIRWTAGRL